MKAKPLCWILLLVMLVHWIGLSWLHQQLQVFKPLVPMAEPLLTRLLQPSEPVPSQPRIVSLAVKSGKATAVDEGQAETPAIPQLPTTPDEPVAEAKTSQMPEVVNTSQPEVTETPLVTDTWPVDTRLTYVLTGNYRGPLYGSARVQWQREQSRYQVRVDLSLALVVRVSMISQGEATDAGLRPGAYEEQYPTGVQRMVFEDGYVKFPNGIQQQRPLTVQDTASQFVELTHRFSSDPGALKPGAEVPVWLARPQGMALWTYDVTAQETLQLGELGVVQAFHLHPRPIDNPRGVITAEMWFAPSLQYLPVRVRIALGAENFVDLLVERIEQGDASASR